MGTGLLDDESLNEYDSAAASQAVPAGLNQVGAAAAGVSREDPAYADSQLGQSTLDYGMSGVARAWYTGANQADVENGWDTEFVKEWMKQDEAAAANGTSLDFFDQPGATGVVTYDRKSKDGTELTFGDIYQGGKKVGNVYDELGTDTANLMMSDLLMDADQKAHLYAQSDRVVDPEAEVKMPGLDEAVQSLRQDRSAELEDAVQKGLFNEGVTAREEDIRKGLGDEAIVAGGAAGGAALGAGIGTLVTPGIGTAVGAGVGAVAGGLGAGLNQDALVEQAARAYEITSMSMDENGRLAGLATGLNQWSGFGAKLISPISNLTQGTYDWAEGDLGDGTSEFYATDKDGERKAPTWMKVADVAATVGDAMLQFATPVGVGLYTAQMGGTIAGETFELGLTGGKSFDYQRAEFDNVFTDDDGNFDPISGAAGIGKIGIDVVQLGLGRGMVGKVRNEALAADAEAVPYSGTLIPGVGGVTGRLPAWLGGQTEPAAARAAMEAGGREVPVGAFSYTVIRGEDGVERAVSRRTTMAFLAPSEQLPAITAGAMARRAAISDRAGARVVGADDYYQAAVQLAHGDKKLRNTIVNAMGEGYEEGLQEIFDTVSHDADLDLATIGNAALYGFAAGAGMSAAVQARGMSADEKMFHQANLARLYMTGGTEGLSKEEWKGWTDVEKRTAAAQSRLNQEVSRTANARIAADQANEMVGGVVAAHRLQDAAMSFFDQQNARANAGTDRAVVIGQSDSGMTDDTGALLPGVIPNDGVGASSFEVTALLDAHHEGLREQLEVLAQKLKDYDLTLDAALTQEENDAARAALQRQVDQAGKAIEWAEKLAPQIARIVNDMHDGATLASLEGDAEVLNLMLRQAFNRQIDTLNGEALSDEDKDGLARAVSLVFVRDPQDQPGSYQVLVPQVSARLSYTGSHNILEVSHAILDAISGDYDGDKIRSQAQLVLDEEAFTNARSGGHYIGAGASVNIAAPKYEQYIVSAMFDALTEGSGPVRVMAETALIQIGTTIRERYAGRLDEARLDVVLKSFFEAVEAGTPNARSVLLDGLAKDLGGQVSEYARENWSNEWLWIDQVVKSNMNQFQSVYAANRVTPDVTRDAEQATPVRQEGGVATRRQVRAATVGQTMLNMLEGNSLFRMFQKLHYSVWNSSELQFDSSKGDPMQMEDQLRAYAAVSSGVAQSELDRLQSKDEITTRVLVWLERIQGDAPAQSIAVLANMAVSDFETDENGVATPTGKRISLAQMLLKRSVAIDRLKYDAIYEVSPEIKKRHETLLAMTRPESTKKRQGRSNHLNAERAFVEVFGSQQLYTILGDAAAPMGAQLTLEQYLRGYVAKHEKARRQEDARLRLQPEYLSNKARKSSKNMPYEFSEVNADEISAYRSVVDAVVAVGHNRVTFDENGLHGEYAERSDATSEEFQQFHRSVRETLRGYLGGKRTGEMTRDQVQRLLENHPDFARSFMDLVTDQVAGVVIQQQGDNVVVANWVYEMLAIQDSAEAEMHYWRNLLLAELNSLNADSLINVDDRDDEFNTSYSRLPRRMHRIIVDLGRRQGGELALRQFIDRMENSKSLKDFIQWVNETPGVRGETAPITAWVDDVTEFDADKAGGGWTQNLQGAELREAIAVLRASTDRLHEDALTEIALIKSDRLVLQAIRSTEQEKVPGTTEAATQEAHNLRARMQTAIDNAAKMRIGIGPKQMVYQIVGALRGFNPQSHTKGINPANVDVQGFYDAQIDAIGYLTNYNRMLAYLTTQSMDQVGNSMSELSKDDVRTMDDFGNTVEWTKPTVDQMLALFENEETRPMARAILFPQVMERTEDGRISTQMLLGKSLKDLLDGVTMSSMFPTESGRLSEEATFRYASMVEASAREFGGHAQFQRVVNDLVQARTSGASRELNEVDLENMAMQAVRDVVQTLQDAATLSASSTDPDVDLLEPILEKIRTAQHQVRTAARIGADLTDGLTLDQALDIHVEQLKDEAEADKEALVGRPGYTPDERLEALEAIDRQLEEQLRKITAIRTNNDVQVTVELFTITGKPENREAEAAKKQMLTEFVMTHWSMLQKSPEEAKVELDKLATYLSNQANLTLPASIDWGLIGRAAIGVYVDENVSQAPTGTASPLFPDADHPGDQRYFDASYTYLVEQLLDPKSPLLQAAKKLHRMAGRQGLDLPDGQLQETVATTVLDNQQLGPWVTGIAVASIEANQRLDSAAAAASLTQFGSAPPNEAAFNMATRRRYIVPEADQLSTTILRLEDLMVDDPMERQVGYTHGADSTIRMFPLTMLNNRFASQVLVHYTDKNGQQQEVDLLPGHVGRPFLADVDARNSPYQAISLGRIHQALSLMNDQVQDPNAVRVEIKYFHPDTQPGGRDWTNNLFYEGTNFSLDADEFESLGAGFWFANGGLSPAGQAAALQASKLGLPAIEAIDLPTAATRVSYEDLYLTDFAGMIRGKTFEVMKTDLGFGKLEPEFFNTVYKRMKMHHYLRGQEGGQDVLLTAEQVMERQRTGVALPDNATLWVPSDTVLRSMLGEPGGKGVDRLFPEQLTVDLSQIKRWTGDTAAVIERFRGAIDPTPMPIEKTMLKGRAKQHQFTVRPRQDVKQKNMFDQQRLRWQTLRSQIGIARDSHRSDDFDMQRNLLRAREVMGDMLDAANLSFGWRPGGVPWVGPRKPTDSAADEQVFRELTAMLASDQGRTGWIFRENAQAYAPGGLLSGTSLQGNEPIQYTVAPGEPVVIMLDSFEGTHEQAKAKAQQRIDYFVGRGATIALGDLTSRGNLSAELRGYLQSSNYELVPGSRGVYMPLEFGSRYQNIRARMSTLTEVEGVSPRSHAAIFHALDLPVEENSAWVVDNKSRRLASVALTMNLVPVDAFAGFGVPVESLHNETQIEVVRNHLLGLDNEEGRAFLREQSNKWITKPKDRAKADEEFNKSWAKLIDRIKENPGSMLPQPGDTFGTGDFIPLVNTLNGAPQVLLYRHGNKAPVVEDVEAMLRQQLNGSRQNIAVYSSKSEPNATTHEGKVLEFRPRSGYGLQVQMTIPLQQFGAKKQLEWNGLKYILVPKPSRIKLPGFGFFKNGWSVDIIGSMHDTLSKEAFRGLIDNHRNAFTYFGMNFHGDMTEFFFPGQRDDAEARQNTITILDQIVNAPDRLPLINAHDMLSGGALHRSFLALLPQVGGNQNLWAQRLGSTDVTSQIATAMIIYLMTDGAKVEHVLKSGGFNDDENTDQSRQSRRMPRVFTQFFDHAPMNSELRTEMFRRFNAQIYHPANAPAGTGYAIDQTFKFHIINSRVSAPSSGDTVVQLSPQDLLKYTDHTTPLGGNVTVDPAEAAKHPVTLSIDTVNGKARISDGNHRVNAAAASGVASIPVVIRVDTGNKRRAAGPGQPYAGEFDSLVFSAAGASGDNLVGWLQFAELHDSGDNPVKNGMSYDPDGRQDVSLHSASIAAQAARFGTLPGRKAGLALRRITGEKVTRFKSDEIDGGAWEMITRFARSRTGVTSQWRFQAPAEHMRRDLALEAVIQFRKPLDQQLKSWSDEERKDYLDLRKEIVQELGLKPKQAVLVDYWVRQHLGQPVSTDRNDVPQGNVTGRAAVQVADDILKNVQDHYLPTLGAEVPMLHLHDLQLIYSANRHSTVKWEPRESLSKGNQLTAKSWDDWVVVSLGSALTADNLFDPMFLLALDGHMHTYQGATQQMMDLPVSMNALVSTGSLDPKVNMAAQSLNLVDEKGRFRSSIDPNVDLLNSESVIMDTERATVRNILGGQRVGGKYRGEFPPASEIAKRRAARRKWRKENGVPFYVPQSTRNLRKNGVTLRDDASTTNAFIRSLINIRVGTATINPALYISMGPEQWVRGTLDRAANIITGQSTVGATGYLHSRLTESVMGKQGRGAKLMEAFGLEAVFTPQQRGKLRRLYDSLGDNKDFRSMIYRDLVYLRPGAMGHGRFERFLESYAKFGTMMQDPTHGMRAKTLARRYMEAVIQHIERTPTRNVLSVDQLVANMSTDPEYLRNNYPEAHEAGSNAIAQLRSLKDTVLGKTLKGIYEPLATSDNLFVNTVIGNLMLKIPLLFSGYATNVLTTITGAQGFDQMTAMFLEGRAKGPNHWIGRVQRKFRGDEITDVDDENFDMGSVLEGIDLSRSFIRGGLTHTGIFLMGMAAGGLGLSGEDDETKKRRRLAALQGAPFVYDPRSLENDFRNDDAIFSDWLPTFGGSEGMVHLNWMLKQFISPILGMERFFETGDFHHVTWGFMDAVGAFPLINSLMVDDALTTAHDLAAQAAHESGKPNGMPAAVGLLANAVGTYERMLFEWSFVNQMYVSLDTWDRDSYALPLRNSTGDINTDIEGNARENNLALSEYVDPETGEVKVGYTSRDSTSAALHALTEKRATLGFLATLGDSVGLGSTDYWRYNMPIKTREIEVQTETMPTAQLYLAGELLGGELQQQPNLTPKELEEAVRNQMAAQLGYFPPDGVVMPVARRLSRESGYAMQEKGSVLDPANYTDASTTEGALLLYRSMIKGEVPLDSEALQGIHISFDQRSEIQVQWQSAIIQEGMNLGLDKSKAEDRMERLWNGPFDDPRIKGIGDILWNKKGEPGFSYDDSVTYQQLNTTYVKGPDGFPWATGRQMHGFAGILGALGILPILPQLGPGSDAMGQDQRKNSTDLVNNSNTGLRGLVRVDDSRNVPTDKEIADAIIKATEEAKGKDYTPFTPYASSSGGGYGGFYGGYGGYGGGGGGYYSGPRIYFSEMRDLADIRTPFGNNIPFINTSNPQIRRGDVRRERVWSERGRLKQWQ